MSAIPPKTDLDGFIKSMAEGVEGAFKKGVKYGRYLEQQERLAARPVCCERCRAWGESPIPNYKETGWCNIMMNYTEPDFYCAFGSRLERKDAT